MKMSDPDFWNNPERAKKISQEATLLKTEVEGHEKLEEQVTDLIDYLDMAIDEGDTIWLTKSNRSIIHSLRKLKKRSSSALVWRI